MSLIQNANTNMRFNINKIRSIEGWLTDNESETLYEIAQDVIPDNTIVEIGSWKGKSTLALAMGSHDGRDADIYAIDPHVGSNEHHKRYGKIDTYKEFTDNIKRSGLSGFVKPIRDYSLNASKKFNLPVGFLFIDGAHDYNSVKSDHENWENKVPEFGIIGFHDSWHSMAVQIYTSRLLVFSMKYRNPKLIDTLTVMQKIDKDKLKLSEWYYNIFFILWRFMIGWIGTLKMDFQGDTVGRFRSKSPH